MSKSYKNQLQDGIFPLIYRKNDCYKLNLTIAIHIDIS